MEPKDTKTLSTKCLALVFRERKSRTQSSAKCASPSDPSDRKATVKSSQNLFDDFISENAYCYWNPHLEESVKNLKYEGHIKPLTVLVTGRDIYLDTVKSAWTRRALRSPNGFALHRIGEIPVIEMSVVAQTQFTPLPEALCISIADLTKTSKDASFDTILDCLKEKYRGMQQPSETVVYEMLGTLIKERKIYHTGSGYHLVTPDMYQPGGKSIKLQDHHLVIGGADTPNGVTPTIYIPLMNPGNNADMVSISCQTDTSPSACDTSKELSDNLDQSLDKEDKSKSKMDRSHPMRESKKNKKDKDRDLVRSASMRYSEDKAKGLVKDVNLRTSEAHQDKDKGEKSSLLSKLFGRNKAKESAPNTEDDTDEGPQIEYATFSAQFPPPEWQWYESQVAQMIPPQQPSFVRSSAARAKTWHHAARHSMLTDPDTQSETDGVYDEICVHANDCPVSRAQTLPAEFGQPSMDDTSPKIPRNCSSQSDSWSSLSDLPTKPPYRPGSKLASKPVRTPHRPQDRVHGIDRPSSAAFENVQADRCSRNVQSRLRDSYQFSSDYSAPEDAGKYPQEQREMLNNATAQATPERPSHVTKVFKKYRQMKCPAVYNNDISVEYKGKMPKKGAILSMSRDSGVNCIGLASNKHPPKPQLFGKKHYNTETDLDHPLSAPNNRILETDTTNDDTDRSQTVVHHALIHKHAGASPEDSGFNSPKPVTETASPHTPNSNLPSPVPSTPSTSPQYQHDKTNHSASSAQQHDSEHSDPYDKTYHHHHHHHHYIPNESQDNTSVQHHLDPAVNGHDLANNGSASTLWSDTSEQTVREVRPSGPQDHGPPVNISKCSSSSPPAVRRVTETSPLRQVVMRTEPFREIHLVPENSKYNQDPGSSGRHHDKHSGGSAHHRKSHKASGKHGKVRPPRGKSTPAKHRPLPGLSAGPLSHQASGRCPTRRYPSENNTHNTYHNVHSYNNDDSDDSCDPPPPRDYSVVGVI